MRTSALRSSVSKSETKKSIPGWLRRAVSTAKALKSNPETRERGNSAASTAVPSPRAQPQSRIDRAPASISSATEAGRYLTRRSMKERDCWRPPSVSQSVEKRWSQ